MCAVSVIYDIFSKIPDDKFNRELVDIFKSMVDQAETIDRLTGQPDCADPEKAKVAEHIADLEKELEK